MENFKKILSIIIKLAVLLLWASNILRILWFTQAPNYEELVVRGKITIIHLVVVLVAVKILDCLENLIKRKINDVPKEDTEHG